MAIETTTIFPQVSDDDPERLHVLMVTPFYGDGGGVGTCALEIREALLAHCSIDVLHWWPRFNQPRLIDHEGRVTPLPSLQAFLDAPRHYDVLHFQSAAYSDRFGGGFTDILSRYPTARMVYTIHSLAAYHGEILEDMDAMKDNIADQDECMTHAEQVFLLTEGIREIALRYHPQHAHKFTVIPNGTPPVTTTDEVRETQAELVETYAIDPEETVFLYMGRISREKGIYELIESLPTLVATYSKLRLLIAGNRPGDKNVEKIRAYFAEEGLTENEDYSFLGWVDGVTKNACYRLADYVIMPSYYEHMPITALEAMIRKKPVLLTDMESLHTTFHMGDPERALVLPIRTARSTPAIAEAVEHAMSHPAQVADVVARAYREVCENLTWARVIERYMDVYRSIIAEPRRAEHGEQAREDEGFDTRFKLRFDRVFNLCFEGSFAHNMGDYQSAIASYAEVLELAPDNECAIEGLQNAYQARVEQLRVRLQESPFDIAIIHELQSVSEALRRMLVSKARPQPEISAIMPVFIKSDHKNGVRYLIEALNSVVAQNVNMPTDIILVNDKSEVDISELLMRNYRDLLLEIRDESGLRAFERPGRDTPLTISLINKHTNSGNDVAPRNLGIVEALYRGSRYITHIDSDDRMPPNRLRTSLEYMGRAPTTDMMHGRHRCIDENGVVIDGTKVDGWFNFSRKFTFGMDQTDPRNDRKSKRHEARELEILGKDNWVHGGTVTYRSNVLLRIGLENLAPDRRYGADHVFWQKMSRVATMDYLSCILTEHRLHGETMTQGGR